MRIDFREIDEVCKQVIDPSEIEGLMTLPYGKDGTILGGLRSVGRVVRPQARAKQTKAQEKDGKPGTLWPKSYTWSNGTDDGRYGKGIPTLDGYQLTGKGSLRLIKATGVARLESVSDDGDIDFGDD